MAKIATIQFMFTLKRLFISSERTKETRPPPWMIAERFNHHVSFDGGAEHQRHVPLGGGEHTVVRVAGHEE